MNPGLIEMMARDRTTELRAAAANRPSQSKGGAGIATRSASSQSSPYMHLGNPQRVIGWFLVSVGLRLALPRTPIGPPR